MPTQTQTWDPIPNNPDEIKRVLEEMRQKGLTEIQISNKREGKTSRILNLNDPEDCKTALDILTRRAVRET